MDQTKLLIVCGLGRSGTTLVGSLLRQSPAIEVFIETPHLSRFSGLAEVIAQFREWCEEIRQNPHEKWRGVDEHFIKNGVEEIFRGFSRAFVPRRGRAAKDWGADVYRGARICLKRPEAEMDAAPYERLFPELKPTYIYCVRDPLQIYQSTLSVAWGTEVSPAAFLKKLRRSLASVKALEGSGSTEERVCFVNIEAASRDLGARRAIVARLFRTVGVEMGSEVEKFVEEWPPVNRTKQVYGNKQFLSAAEVADRISHLERLIAEEPGLQSDIADLLAKGEAG